MILISRLIYASASLWCLIAQTQQLAASAFQPKAAASITHHHGAFSGRPRLQLVPEILHDSIIQHPQLLAISFTTFATSSSSASILLTAENKAAAAVAEWRQYVPLVVSVGVILDILLGSPLANNLVLGPMKRASEKGARGGGGGDSTTANSNNRESENDNNGGRSLFSSYSGNNNNNNNNNNLGGTRSSDKGSSRRRERVDSEAIAQAALNKALNTLELKRFLEENKTDEQKYEEVRRKIDKQMEELV